MSLHYGSTNNYLIHELTIIRPELLSSPDISSTIVYAHFISGGNGDGSRGNCGSLSQRGNGPFLLQNVQADPGAHRPTCWVGTRVPYRG